MAVKFFLDTNAIIALLQNNKGILDSIANASEIYASVISELEFKSFSDLSQNDYTLFEEFLSRINIIDLEQSNKELIDKVILIRKTYKLKLPDAVIAASAMVSDAVLLSADVGFQKIKELKVGTW